MRDHTQFHDRRPARRFTHYALAFVMGAAITALVFTFATERSVSPDQVAGNMLPGTTFKGWETIATRTLEFDGGQAVAKTVAARTSSGRNLVWCEIELDSQDPVELAVDFQKGPLKLVSFSPGESGGEAVMTGDGMRLLHTGKADYKILLQRRGQMSPDLHISVLGTNVTESLPTVPSARS